MAQYPIKMLKDENGTPFVPLVAPEAVKDTQGTDWQTLLDRKLEKTNIIAGQNVTITTDGNDITINSAAGGASANVIDNLDQTTGGVGVLDAHQGHVLKGMIPDVVNNLTTVDTTKALSAYQGYLLNHKVVPTGGAAGQVLKKKSATDNDLEWGDAADPNAISGDSSVKKIVALTYDEYEDLVANGEVEQDTEYHITGRQSSSGDIEALVNYLILESYDRMHPVGSLEFNTSGINPAEYLGFGTWIAWGQGQVPVGVNTDDTDFNTVEKSGGSKNHSHTISHTHGVPGVQHYHTLSDNGWSNLVMHGSGYMCYRERTTPAWTPNFSTLTTHQDSTHTSEGYGATLGGTTDNATPSATTTNSQSTTDSGSASTLQPYITCYMWKRTS